MGSTRLAVGIPLARVIVARRGPIRDKSIRNLLIEK